MATSGNLAWVYKARRNDPPSIKLAVVEMTDSIQGKVDSVDSVICRFVSFILSIGDGSAKEISGNELIVDFKNRQIQFPKLDFSTQYFPSSVGDSLIRYAAFISPPEYETGSNETHIVALSTWQHPNKDIRNIYLVMNESDALLMMNAISRLISRHSMTKAQEFYPLVTGRVLVSKCTTNQHSENDPNCCDRQKLMFFILDPESLSFFEHGFSIKPSHDFRFYKEKGSRAIDIIFLSKDSTYIQLRQGNHICIIRKNFNSVADTKAYDMLLKLLKENAIKPKPEEYFMSYLEKDKMSVVASQQLESRRRPGNKMDQDFHESGWSGSQMTSGQDSQESRWPLRADEQYRPRDEQWISDLYTGRHIDRDLDEGMQLIWFTFEHDLRECIQRGDVPFTAVESGGLDPNSASHLQRSVEDIKDQLLNNDMALALSRLQACLNTFKDTLLQPVSTLDQVTLMKRIYFLSGKD